MAFSHSILSHKIRKYFKKFLLGCIFPMLLHMQIAIDEIMKLIGKKIIEVSTSSNRRWETIDFLPIEQRKKDISFELLNCEKFSKSRMTISGCFKFQSWFDKFGNFSIFYPYIINCVVKLPRILSLWKNSIHFGFALDWIFWCFPIRITIYKGNCYGN